jgi:hypothetical protein
MRKLIAGAIVAAALTVPATPALAIHHGSHLGTFVPRCAHSSNALGEPASGIANTGNSNGATGGISHNPASPNCRGVED